MNAGTITGIALLCVCIVALTAVMLIVYKPAYS